MRPDVGRRDFLKLGLSALAAPALTSCLYPDVAETARRTSARLTARPGIPALAATPGQTRLGLSSGRDGYLYVPLGYSPDTPLPLLIGLHGAGGSSDSWSSYVARAEARGMVLLAPDSRYQTWNVAGIHWDVDVDFLDAALAHTFERCRIDPARIALAGFSDGASFALWAGLVNGDLFTHLVAYSPGMLVTSPTPVGKPAIFVSHGTLDPVIPVTVSKDQIVPYLRDAGYDVTFQQFDGEHVVPAVVSETALDWFFGIAPPPAASAGRRLEVQR